jgi:hypothetical protein
MEITREFIQAEMDEVQRELAKAKTFVVQAETSLAIYGMLLARLNADDGNLADLSESDNLANLGINPGGTD